MTQDKVINIKNNKLCIYVPKKVVEIGKKLRINFSLISTEAIVLYIISRLDELSRMPDDMLAEFGLSREKLIEIAKEFNKLQNKIFIKLLIRLLKGNSIVY